MSYTIIMHVETLTTSASIQVKKHRPRLGKLCRKEVLPAQHKQSSRQVWHSMHMLLVARDLLTILRGKAQVKGEAWQDVVHVWRQPRDSALLHGPQPGSNGTFWISACEMLGRAPVDAQAVHPHVLDDLHALHQRLQVSQHPKTYCWKCLDH